MPKNDPKSDRHHPPQLTPADMGVILSEFERESLRRRRAFALQLRVLVDDQEVKLWHLCEQKSLVIDIDPAARVLEVVACEKGVDFCLATNLLQMGNTDQAESVELEAGQQLHFTKEKIVLPQQNKEQWRITITYKETALFRIIALYLHHLLHPYLSSLLTKFVSPYGLVYVTGMLAISILLSSIWIFMHLNTYNSLPEVVTNPSSLPNNMEKPAVISSPLPYNNYTDQAGKNNPHTIKSPKQNQRRNLTKPNGSEVDSLRGRKTSIYLYAEGTASAATADLLSETLNKAKREIAQNKQLALTSEAGTATYLLEVRISQNETNWVMVLYMRDEEQTLVWSREFLHSIDEQDVSTAFVKEILTQLHTTFLAGR